jgi:hypothetical protein
MSTADPPITPAPHGRRTMLAINTLATAGPALLLVAAADIPPRDGNDEALLWLATVGALLAVAQGALIAAGHARLVAAARAVRLLHFLACAIPLATLCAITLTALDPVLRGDGVGLGWEWRRFVLLFVAFGIVHHIGAFVAFVAYELLGRHVYGVATVGGANH